MKPKTGGGGNDGDVVTVKTRAIAKKGKVEKTDALRAPFMGYAEAERGWSLNP